MSDDKLSKNHHHVLVIEDEIIQQEILADCLELEEMIPICCHTGQEALKTCQNQLINVAILDLHLPDMEGLQLVKALKKQNPDIKIIINTGYATLETAMAAINEDVFAYVKKMGNVEELLGHVHRAFHTHLAKYSETLEVVVQQRTADLLKTNQTLRDEIKHRKQVEESLRTSEARFRKIFEESPLGMVMGDDESRIIKANAMFSQMSGYTEQELSSMTFIEMTYPDDLDENLKTREQLFEGKILRSQFEKRYIKKNGEIFWANVTASTIRDDEGNPLYALAMIEDMTEKKRIQQQIKALNEELEQRVIDRTAQLQVANHELEAFSYSVSHDLRAPLRHINGFIELLLSHQGHQLDEKSLRYAHIVANSAKEMGQLIDDLLTFSRTSRLEMETRSVGLNKLISDVQENLTRLLKDRKITWKIDSLPRVRADLRLMRIVFDNLLSNAIKYTASCADAQIEIGVLPYDKNSVKPNSTATFFVRDNGVGFEQEYSHKLFEVFQRLHTSDEFEGTGIGLAIVQRIIHRHGGKIWAEGIPNQGATLYFTLTLALDNKKE